MNDKYNTIWIWNTKGKKVWKLNKEQQYGYFVQSENSWLNKY